MATEPLSPSSQPGLLRPIFIPHGVDPASLPESLQAALREVVEPAYRELVLDARPGLEQSAGLTVVHLLWLEVVEQLSLAQELSRHGQEIPSSQEAERRRKRIDSHLRLTGAKIKASRLLLRLEEFRFKRGPDLTVTPSGPPRSAPTKGLSGPDKTPETHDSDER